MDFYKRLKRLTESSVLLEYNRKDLRNFVGDEYAAKFFNLRDKLQAPENDLGHWIKKDDVEAFKKFIDDWESGAIKSKTQKKKEERIAGADLVFNDKGWKVYHVTTYDAAKQLGSGTTWCITGRYRGYESRGKQYFDSYIKDYKLNGYYFIFDLLNKDPNTNDYQKYCAGVGTDNKLKFLYNGMQDSNITNEGIPIQDSSREVDLIPGVKIPFKVLLSIKDNVLYKVDRYIHSEVKLPDGLTGIAHRCFYNNHNINKVILPDSLKTIGAGAFMNSSLQIINLNKVEALGRGVFYNGYNLLTIDLGTELQDIPQNTFGGCPNLSQVVIGPQIKSIDETAFDDEDINVVFYTDNPIAIEYAEKHNIRYKTSKEVK